MSGARADEDLPAYLGGPEDGPAAIPMRPAMDIARAGARWIATAVAETRTAMSATPSPSPFPAGASSMALPGDWFPPVRRSPAALTGGFLRMVDLPGFRLGAMLDEWWSGAAVDGTSTIDRRLRLGPPRRDHLGGFTIAGRIRRWTRFHWTPVVLELWPRHGRWTMITMTPQGGVLTTRRYFRAGHSAIDRLTRTLAATRAAYG